MPTAEQPIWAAASVCCSSAAMHDKCIARVRDSDVDVTGRVQGTFSHRVRRETRGRRRHAFANGWATSAPACTFSEGEGEVVP